LFYNSFTINTIIKTQKTHLIYYITARHTRNIDFIVHRLFDVNCQGSDLIARYMISLESYLSAVLCTFQTGSNIYAHPTRSNRLIWIYYDADLIFYNIIKALGIIPPVDYFPDNVHRNMQVNDAAAISGFTEATCV